MALANRNVGKEASKQQTFNVEREWEAMLRLLLGMQVAFANCRTICPFDGHW